MDGVDWESVGVVYETDRIVADPTVVFFKEKYYMALTVIHSEDLAAS